MSSGLIARVATPPRRTSPDVGLMRPHMSFMSVVFPLRWSPRARPSPRLYGEVEAVEYRVRRALDASVLHVYVAKGHGGLCAGRTRAVGAPLGHRIIARSASAA